MIRSKFWKIMLGIGATAVVVWFLWTRVLDTLANRSRVSNEVSFLVDRAKSGEDKNQIVAQLLRRSKSNYHFEAVAATVGLGEMEDAATPVVNDIADLMESNNSAVRREAANTLSKLGSRSTAALDKLIKQAIKVPSDEVSLFAIEAIGKIGKPAVQYLPLLKSRSEDENIVFQNSIQITIDKLEELVEVPLED